MFFNKKKYFDILFSILKLTFYKLKKLCFLLFFTFSGIVNSQTQFTFSDSKKSETIKFKLASNLIIIPIEVNGANLSFLLDTGVTKPILFNITQNDSLEIKNITKIVLKGLGGGMPVKAYRSTGNTFNVNGIFNKNQDLYVILDEKINFSPRLGYPVHGIIGYDFFKNLVVDINYVSKKIKVYSPSKFKSKKCKTCETFDLEIIGNKPFIRASSMGEHIEGIDLKLLIDSGSSDALWLIENEDKNLAVPEKSFEDFLGFGLSGGIYGHRARLEHFSIGGFNLKEVKVAFPDSVSIKHLRKVNDRDGSIGGEILKRFRVTFNYKENKITLKRNANFNKPFKFNMSGIELMQTGNRLVKELETRNQVLINDENKSLKGITILPGEKYKYSLKPAFEIVEVREQSPAHLAGLRKGDILLSVNGKFVHRYTLDQIIEMINEEEGKLIRLIIERNLEEMKFVFKLESLL
ncbi:aspartyl protease family protein [Abyssalbus ytuae]|uniref:Aspartyl protease family protein n=1 Tax=Abyssalbus ytuae TaxID=2926907 RepID=A0A9E6ZJX6_9FLAO|nr:aspartyl protease family protein [Abyssalbus ytuae]UOB16994.1 aspartyl protease family protein [Abyssalbus ytuae]